MGDVVTLNMVTRLDLPADRVIEAALGELDNVVIVGYTKAGDEYFASSYAGGPEVLWLLERAKKRLLAVPESPEFNGGAA